MPPGDQQPLGDPPPGFRYRVVEVPLDQVLGDTTMSTMSPYSSEGGMASGISGGDIALDGYDPLLEDIIRQQLYESQQPFPPAGEGAPPDLVEALPPSRAAVAEAAQVASPVISAEAAKEEEEMKEMIRVMHEEQQPLAGMLLSFLPAFLLLLLFIPIGIFLFFSQGSVTVVVCPFQSCVDDAQRFDTIMEHASVSACVDFYEHTCAYWRETNPVPDYAWRHSFLDHMRMNIEADVHHALKAQSQRRARSITTGLVTTMIDIYRGCISKQDSEKGRKAMYDLDVAMFRANWSLAQVLSELVLQFDIDGFFRVRFLHSEFSYPRGYLELDFPSLVIRPENLLQRGAVLKDADKRLLYEATVEMYDALRIHPGPERRTRAERVVDLVKAVATRILNLKPTDVENPVAYRRVTDFMGSKVMDWHLYFSEVTHRSLQRLPFVVVKLVNRHYLLDINQFFDSLSDPSGDTTHFMDYLRLLLFLNFAAALPNLSKVTEAYWRFSHDLRQEPDRWRLCLYFLDDILPRSLSWFYHHYHLTRRDSKEVEKMKVVMFFVPGLVEGDAIQIPPPTVDVDTSNIVSAALEARRIEVMTYYNFSSFVERGKQFGPPYKVLDLNCRYNYGTNTLYIPHALFHGPLYREGEKNLVYLPKLLHIIGMGMGKALDSRGIHVSSEPDDSDWLWGESLQRWENNTACFRTIYNVLDPRTRRQVDAVRTFPGNLVDSMALRAALWYFRHRAREAAHPKPDFQLPEGRNLSSDEIFFYSFGEYMCEVLKPAAHNKVIDFGYLPPNRVRLNTLLRNTPEFATAFNCPSTSQMVLPTANYCMAFPPKEHYVIMPIDPYTTPMPTVGP
ncbi:neprilysin-2-like isoform X2 [Dermacentor albipictus]|uniref:neprilysin-2-like isoform X2 n=1 Tax=Dermacentor albipictus TaxID=60249 RepID=UPI0031FE262C